MAWFQMWPLLRDDRGALIGQERAGDPLRGLWHDRKRPFEVPWAKLTPLVMVVGFAMMAWARGGFSVSTRQMVSFLCVYGIAFTCMHLAFRRAAKTPGSAIWKRVWSGIAWLAAYRHCGACGYSLGEVEPDGDGIATCPECGSAWHRDRWTHAGRDPREDREMLAWLRMRRGGRRDGFDDRGLPVALREVWSPRWLCNDAFPPEVRGRVRARLVRLAWRRIGWMSAVAIGAWIAGVAALMRWRDPVPRYWWLHLGLIGAITGVMLAGVIYVIVRTAARSSEVRDVSLDEGRCPSCGEGLEGRKAEFDGCVTCAPCRHAWRRNE
jgi:ssDNA-binding Zn-finger/Zn-ribbon topoisomerase 1